MILYNAHGDYIVGPPIPLGTRAGREIPNEQRLQKSPTRMAAARDIFLKGHPSRRVRSLSSVYNCMGLIFASRRTGIDPDYLPLILADDGYRRIPYENALVAGDVVVYRDESGALTHVGLVTDVKADLRGATWEISVLSQWGQDGEYFHRVDDVSPRLGKPAEYWTDRV